MRQRSLAVVAALLGAMGFTFVPPQTGGEEAFVVSPAGSQPAPKSPLPPLRGQSIVAAVRELLGGMGVAREASAKPNGGRRHGRVKPMRASRTKARKRRRCRVKRRAHK